MLNSLIYTAQEKQDGLTGLDFRGIRRSLVIETSGKAWTFPTRQDYINHLISQGHLGCENELINQRLDLVMAIHHHWHHLGQTGCRFAQLLRKNPEETGWQIEVIPGSDEKAISPEALDHAKQTVELAIQDVNSEMISLIFPGVTSPNSLISLINSLNTLSGWIVVASEEPIETDLRGPLINIAIRVVLNNDSVLSWILGFGPFEFLAATRRSPFTELAIRTKPKISKPTFAELNPDLLAAHLADIPVTVSSNVFHHLWSSTKHTKRNILGLANDTTAKAKVTFTIPANLWQDQVS